MFFDHCPIPKAVEGEASSIEMGGLLTDDRLAANRRRNSSRQTNLNSIAFVRFAIPSFVNLYGAPVYGKDGWRAARTEFETCGWRIVIDRALDAEDAYKDIRDQKVHRITHYGVIRKVDGEAFNLDALNGLLDDLYWLFSFTCATRRGISCWQAFDPYGCRIVQKTEDQWIGPPRTFSWFPEGFENPFPAFADEFIRKWRDDFWRDVLLFAIHILCESNLEELSCESKIVLGQSALEALTEAILVEQLKRPAPGSAAQGLRNLLEHICIPVGIPTRLNKLADAAKQNNWKDGPEAITRIRNMLVHPRASNRSASLSMLTEAKFQASLLCLHYIEVTLLWLCGYDGVYVDRTDLPMMLKKHATTPWKSGGSRP